MTETGSIFKLSEGEWRKDELFEYKPRTSDPWQMHIKWGHIHRGNKDKTHLKTC